MRIAAHVLLPLCLGLAACTTPREACVRNAEAEYRGLLTAIAIAEEERKLASMRARLPGARERRDATIGACYQRFER